ncbi:EamA family transporter [Sandarakinorhabdus cyanobacteriorum]|uniref:EamA family transporter n=1 Tax=Sandarakinorhabdus cyanobacteriorum TaxID=1981098 RepID=A0A255Y676_9SPHN|nr:EamA family transporter [Sandarakinorhabdus cyanobacteriorum]OYQ24757.1 EamA family transporter [Sandarakinorhabdus cyanobacteriorum]
MTSASLSPRALLLALAVVTVWGSNFAIIGVTLHALPPLLFATLRFAAVVFPLIFFVRRPHVPWRILAGYGVAIGVGQFGLLFIAIDGYIAAGIASLLVQSQVVFTIAMAMITSGERLKRLQYGALALALAGVAVIAGHTGGEVTLPGIALVLGAAFGWSLGNMAQRAAGKVDMLGFITWSSLFAVPPLAGLALWFEGWPAIETALAATTPAIWAAVAWQAVGNTLFGYGAWGWLLARYPATSVAPTSLLVPVFGMASTAIWLGEDLPPWKLLAAALIIGGLATNLLATRQR